MPEVGGQRCRVKVRDKSVWRQGPSDFVPTRVVVGSFDQYGRTVRHDVVHSKIVSLKLAKVEIDPNDGVPTARVSFLLQPANGGVSQFSENLCGARRGSPGGECSKQLPDALPDYTLRRHDPDVPRNAVSFNRRSRGNEYSGGLFIPHLCGSGFIFCLGLPQTFQFMLSNSLRRCQPSLFSRSRALLLALARSQSILAHAISHPDPSDFDHSVDSSEPDRKWTFRMSCRSPTPWRPSPRRPLSSPIRLLSFSIAIASRSRSLLSQFNNADRVDPVTGSNLWRRNQAVPGARSVCGKEVSASPPGSARSDGTLPENS